MMQGDYTGCVISFEIKLNISKRKGYKNSITLSFSIILSFLAIFSTQNTVTSDKILCHRLFAL